MTRRTRGSDARSPYRPGRVGMVIFSITVVSPGSASTCLAMASRSSVSACSLRGLEMLTSGSMIGTRPAAGVRFLGLLERARRETARAVKRRAGQHPGPHGVDQVEHLGVGAVAVPPDAVLGQRLRRAAAALVKGSEEAAAGHDFLGLGSVHASLFWHQQYRAGPEGITGATSGAVTAVPHVVR